MEAALLIIGLVIAAAVIGAYMYFKKPPAGGEELGYYSFESGIDYATEGQAANEDIKLLAGLSHGDLAKACNAEPSCVGFNSSGVLKKKLGVRYAHAPWAGQTGLGFFTKV